VEGEEALVEYRLTVTVAQHGHDPENGERLLHGFITTHPEVGAVVDQNTETGELSVTYSVDAEDFSTVAERGSSIFAEGATASGLEPTEVINATFDVVRAEDDARELQPA
jgi:hypothetical protein